MARELDRKTLIERSIIKKYRKVIWNRFVQAIQEYDMIKAGDKIGVCISGGKDSMLLAKCIQHLQKISDVPFEAEFIVMDPGYNPKNRERIIENSKILGVPIHIFNSNIFEVVADGEGTPCYLCAKMRRGFLYNEAQKLGCNKIALGHHFNDAIETTLLSIIYGAEVKTMMPKLKSTGHVGMELIRPLYMVRENDIIAWARYNELEFIRCACRFTEAVEGSSGESKRLEIKKLIADLMKDNKHVEMNIFRSVHNVNLTTVIGYREKDGDDSHSFLEVY